MIGLEDDFEMKNYFCMATGDGAYFLDDEVFIFIVQSNKSNKLSAIKANINQTKTTTTTTTTAQHTIRLMINCGGERDERWCMRT